MEVRRRCFSVEELYKIDCNFILFQLINGTDSAVRTYFCDKGEYNDMATLFFNSQEEAIKQLFHQEGKTHILTVTCISWNLCIDLNIVLYRVMNGLEWVIDFYTPVKIHPVISRHWDSQNWLQNLSGRRKQLLRQANWHSSHTMICLLGVCTLNILWSISQRFTHMFFSLFCFYIVKSVSRFIINWLLLICCIL